jgi:hypothetical protein
MASSDGRRPVIRAGDDKWRRLGELLQLRRADLGYRYRPAFTQERQINIRLVTDIENNYRPNTFLTPTVKEIARAYAVAYDSIIAILKGEADQLTPAAEPAAPPAPAASGQTERLPPATMPQQQRWDAAPYTDRIWELRPALILCIEAARACCGGDREQARRLLALAVEACDGPLRPTAV